MNYVEARKFLDKRQLPGQAQQAVNALLQMTDKMQGAIERLHEALEAGDFEAEGVAVADLDGLCMELKKGREAVGA